MGKRTIISIVALGVFAASVFVLVSQNNIYAYSMMSSGNMDSMMKNMMSGNTMGGSGSGMNCKMMSDSPQDVIIKIKSSQAVSVGKIQSITLLVLDKTTSRPLTDARIVVGIERGAPMSTMDMLGPMFDAKNIGNGKYVVSFILDKPGYYTLHTHVIPAGKSMMSMMNNHEDIGLIAK